MGFTCDFQQHVLHIEKNQFHLSLALAAMASFRNK